MAAAENIDELASALAGAGLVEREPALKVLEALGERWRGMTNFQIMQEVNSIRDRNGLHSRYGEDG